MVQAGKYRHRLTLEQPSETAGDAVVTWATVATVWGSLEALSGTRRDGLYAEGTFRIGMRWTPVAITPRWRVGLEGTTRKFLLTGPPLDVAGVSRELELTATEVV